MKLSFIILTYRRGQLLQRCLDSIYAQEGLPRPYEVIVIDNAGDANALPPPDPDIHLHIERPGRNLNCAGGRNRGMELAQGDYWVFIDDDAAWHRPDDVARLIAHFDDDPACAAVALKSLSPDGEIITGELPHPDKDYLKAVTETTDTVYFYGYGHALRGGAVRQVGFYPDRFQIYMEDYDMSLSLIKAGYRILFDPTVAVFHFKSNLGRPIVGEGYWRYCAVNKSRVGWRHLPWPYPLTTAIIWTLTALVKSRRPRVVVNIWRELWADRHLLAAERQPFQPERLAYLRRIGARLLY
jgi:GT2 family glycosyltransferase